MAVLAATGWALQFLGAEAQRCWRCCRCFPNKNVLQEAVPSTARANPCPCPQPRHSTAALGGLGLTQQSKDSSQNMLGVCVRVEKHQLFPHNQMTKASCAPAARAAKEGARQGSQGKAEDLAANLSPQFLQASFSFQRNNRGTHSIKHFRSWFSEDRESKVEDNLKAFCKILAACSLSTLMGVVLL